MTPFRISPVRPRASQTNSAIATGYSAFRERGKGGGSAPLGDVAHRPVRARAHRPAAPLPAQELLLPGVPLEDRGPHERRDKTTAFREDRDELLRDGGERVG